MTSKVSPPSRDALPGFNESLLILPDALLHGESGPSVPDTAQRQLVLGVDGGATKTIAAIYDITENRAYVAHSGPSNPRAAGMENAADALEHAMHAVLEQSGAHPSEIRSSVLGIAGVDTKTVGDQLLSAVSIAQSMHSIYVVNDTVTAWSSGTYGQPGVAIISGTGSNTFGVNAAGETWRVGGFDWVLGDEGSGYWIGLHAMRAVLEFRDGRGVPTILAERLLKFYGINFVEELTVLVQVPGGNIDKSEVAAFAREVTTAAEEGDQVALQLLERAAHDLAKQVNTVIQHLQLPGKFPVTLVGSVWEAGPLLREPFESSVRIIAPEVSFVIPDLPPMGGALLLAVKAGNLLDSLDIKRFQKEMSQYLG